MNRRHLIGAGVVAAAAGAGWAGWQRRYEGAEQALFGMRFERPGGGELVMQAYLGHALLLNFWAPWCAPCIKEMPLLDGFAQHHPQCRVVGLAVDAPSPVREFLSRRPVTFPVGLVDLKGIDLARSFGNERGDLPFSLLFDRQARLLERKLGQLHPQQLLAWAARLR